jgi:hypothetical protein
MRPADWIEDMDDEGMTLFVDPGDVSGFALFNHEGTFMAKDQADFEGMLTILKDLSMTNLITRIVVEDYRLRKGKQAQQTGSRFQAVQVIGALKFYAHMMVIPLELANVQAKTLGSMYSGVKPPSDHKKSHEIDAYNIGIYWLVANDIIYPPTLKDI